jgi:hypothetical protein
MESEKKKKATKFGQLFSNNTQKPDQVNDRPEDIEKEKKTA